MPKQATIVSKDSLKYSPLGPFMLMSGSVFINRGNNAKAVASLNAAGALIKKEKISTWIFPEGTRNLSNESNMLPLKKGGFHLAVSAGIPIIPIVVENYWHLYHQGLFNEGKIRVKGQCFILYLGFKLTEKRRSSPSHSNHRTHWQGRWRTRCTRSRNDGFCPARNLYARTPTI